MGRSYQPVRLTLAWLEPGSNRDTYIEIWLLGRTPPPAQYQAAPGKNDALVRPQFVAIDFFLVEVLHERDPLPPDDPALGKQRLQPS